MNKQEFLAELRKGLYGLPQDDIEERLTFYSEMIDDRVEEGLTEDEAVCQIGTVEEIVSQTMSDIPLSKLVKEKVKPKRALRVWEIILLVLGSPIWLSLLIAVFAVVISVYAVIWSVIIALWAAEIAVVMCSLGGILSCVVFLVQGNIASGFAMLGGGLICGGVAVFMDFGCNGALKGVLALTKKIFICIKSCFIEKGDKNE